MELILSIISAIFIALIVMMAISVGFALLLWVMMFAIGLSLVFYLRQLWMRWRFLRNAPSPPKIIEGEYRDISE